MELTPPRWRRLALGAGLAAGLAGGLLAASATPAPSAPSASTAAASGATGSSAGSSLSAGAAPIEPGAGRVFGVIDGNLLTDTDGRLNADLDDAVRLGVTAVREQLSWAATEPSPGVYNWAPFDRVARAVAAHHLRMLAVVDFVPGWAAGPGCPFYMCAPASPQEFAGFARAAAARYGSAVQAWEVWNEPNSAAFWAPRPDPAAYAALLRVTARAIRSVAPSDVVVSGGLAPETNDGADVDPRTFLDQVCAAGGLNGVDAVGVHPYSYPVPPDYQAPWNAWQQMADTAVNEHGVLEQCGRANLPMWVTEYGAPTNGPGSEATPGNYRLAAHPDHVSEALQAEMARQAVADVRSSPWIGAFFWYAARDTGTVPTSNERFFGLRRYDGSAKPAWAALQAAMAGS